MKLGAKIVLGFVLTNVIFVVLVAAVFVFMRPVQNGAVNLNENLLPLLEQASRIQFHSAMEGYQMRSYMLDRSDAAWAEAVKHSDAIAQTFKDVEANLQTPHAYYIQVPEVVDTFSALKADYAKYHDLALLVPERQTSIFNARADLMKSHGEFSATLADFTKMQTDSREQEFSTSATYDVMTRRSARVAELRLMKNDIDAMAIIILRAAADSNTGLLSAAPAEIQKVREALTALEKDSRLPESQAFIKKLQDNLNTMDGLLAHLVKTYAESAAAAGERGALNAKASADAAKLQEVGQTMSMQEANNSQAATGRVVMSLIIGTLAAIAVSMLTAFIITRSITRPINAVIAVLSEGSEEVDNASGQLTQSSNTLAEGATENAASLEETSAALEELNSMTNRNADNAVEANSLMDQATKSVEQASLSMESVIRAMGEISISGNEIGKIIKTIDEIAFQTNLLALNAAVEAARAGEAGAGFAVVADEVRNLAIRSADAAKNTSDLIASTISNINSGSEMVNATAENFKIVEHNAGKVAELISEVAEASKEQSQGIGQITTAMTQMDKVTQSNAASAEESASAAGALSLQANNLLMAVDEIRALVHGLGKNGQAKKSKQLAYKSAGSPQPERVARSAATPKALPLDEDFDF